MRALLVLAILLTAGCNPVVCPEGGCEFSETVHPEQAVVRDVVWHGYFGRTDEPVDVTWVVMGNGNQFGQGFTVQYTPYRVYGWTDPGLTHSWVMNKDWYTLIHEQLHVVLGRLYGDGDPGHTRPEWGPYLDGAFDALDAVVPPNGHDFHG